MQQGKKPEGERSLSIMDSRGRSQRGEGRKQRDEAEPFFYNGTVVSLFFMKIQIVNRLTAD